MQHLHYHRNYFINHYSCLARPKLYAKASTICIIIAIILLITTDVCCSPCVIRPKLYAKRVPAVSLTSSPVRRQLLEDISPLPAAPERSHLFGKRSVTNTQNQISDNKKKTGWHGEMPRNNR